MSRHHRHHDPPPQACCSCGCVCGCGCSAPAPCGGGGYYPAPPQPAPASDQLLHAIAAHLLLNSAPPPPPPVQPQPHQPPPQPPAAHQANLYSSHAYQYHQHQQVQQQQGPNPHAYPQPPPPQHQQHHQQEPQPHAYPQPPVPPPQQQQPYPHDQGQLLLHSLLRRVAALETTLPHCFPSPPPIPQPHLKVRNPHRPHHGAAAHQDEDADDPPSPPPRRARGGRPPPPPSEWELAARTIQGHFRRFLARRSRTLRQLKELAILRSKAASLRGSLSGSGRRRCKDPVAVSEAAMGLLLHLDGIQGGDPMIREGKRAVSRELSRILEFVDKVLVKDHEEMALDNGEYPEGCHGAPVANPPTVNRKVSFQARDEEDESSESSSSAEADERKGANSKPGLAAPAPVHMEPRRTAGEMR